MIGALAWLRGDLKRLLAIGVVVACVLFAGGANAALVKVGNLVLTADGGFTPLKLPRQTFTPINFTGHADLKSVDGSVPPALQQVVLSFDRDGRLSTAGLPVCQPSLLEEATPAEARNRCPNAIVGTGHVSALITREEGPADPGQLAGHALQRPPPGRQPDRHPPRPHHGAGDPDLRGDDPDRKARRPLPLPRHG